MTKMKFLLFAAIFATLTGIGLYGADYSKEISEVKEGLRTEAKASWWGFDKSDATKCLQDAINSGVKKLVVDNTGSEWIVNPIKLASDQEIIFSDGVVISAKKGSFKKIGDNLFSCRGGENITLRGEGKAILQMNKDDYEDKANYALGEWRHCINLGGCTNIVIRNLTVKNSGGDGIYIGAGVKPYCENVLLEDVILDAHNRLGMGVISAENLMIRLCKFLNTSGRSPAGGIDFEPNRPEERLVNCVVEDCMFANNLRGAASSVSPNNLNISSKPVSVTFRRCTFENNALSIFLYPSRNSAADPATGLVEFIDCRLGNTVLFHDPVANGIKIIFKNCEVDNRKGKGAAFSIICKEAQRRFIGNIYFDNVTVLDDQASREPIAVKYQGSGDIADSITGILNVSSNGKTTQFNLPEFVKRKQEEVFRINSQKPAVVDLAKLQIPASDVPRDNNSEVYLRGKFTFLQYAVKGQEITIDSRAVQVGNYTGNTDLKLEDPGGKAVKIYSLPPDGKVYPIAFSAALTGFYRVLCPGTVQRLDITSKHRGNAILINNFQTLLPICGKIYFQVPSGVREFCVAVAADADADVALLDPSGKVVMEHREINSMQLFSATRTDISKAEIWSINISKAVWHVTLRFYAPLAPLFSTNPSTLPLLKDKE
jgi:hypothetical protein